ncbi:TraR/DksA family transcriptional regulator [Siccibacter colletis]|uniref:TraR/DksA family transcriptional regulator n=1 Tax=Siccibacter colletis TaxID=1505757 RepID=UPI0028BD79BF|nr:TraR/DksA family transcriptional regulator [Siccibacter colletis]WNN49044.1 TraR/DksA family transcriptional regulator [Siccibacter colletis]
MADEIDIAQQYEQEARERYIINARSRLIGPSRLTCASCDEPIPASRRAILPGVSCCVTCQEIAELKQKHHRSGV